MKLNRLSMIEVIDEIEADREKRHNEAQQPAIDAWQKAVADYKRDIAPKLTTALRGLVDKARKGVVLTADDLRKELGIDRYEETITFVGPFNPTNDRYGRRQQITEQPSVTAYQPDRELAALRKILTQMTNDEFVTTSVLFELGFSPSLFVKKQVTS